MVDDTYWNWLVVEDFWIHIDLRGRGYGRQLLALAEATAQVRGCHRAQLTTYSGSTGSHGLTSPHGTQGVPEAAVLPNSAPSMGLVRRSASPV